MTAMASFKVEFPRRQAMLKVYEDRDPAYPWQDVSAYESCLHGRKVVAHVPVLVWPLPTLAGFFVVERQDGSCTLAHSNDLTFLGSNELFEQYDWSTDEA